MIPAFTMGVIAAAAFPDTGSVAGDSMWSSVLMLLHGDGSTADSSSHARSVSSSSSVTSANEAGCFGSAALRIPDGGFAEWSSLSMLSDGVWTIEGRVKFVAMPSTVRAHLFGCWSGSTGWTVDMSQNGLNFFLGRDGAGASIASGGTITSGTWFHVAFVLTITSSSMTLQPFVNGNPGTLATESRPTTSTAHPFRLGSRSDGSLPQNVWWDDVRITSGARYTVVFTPPTSALPDAT